MEIDFCRRCGSPLKPLESGSLLCANHHKIYMSSSPTVGVFLIDAEGNVVLSVRGIEPRKGMLDTFGGFLEPEENFEHALRRELREELSLEPDEYSEPVYLTSSNGHYPYGGETITIISNLYYARLLTSRELVPADDVAAIHTSPIDEIDPEMLHDIDIRAGLAKLKEVL